MTRYRNPWHRADARDMYGPEFYETDAAPIAHAGSLIYERIRGKVWDVVRDGACVTQRAGLDGAKEAARSAK